MLNAKRKKELKKRINELENKIVEMHDERERLLKKSIKLMNKINELIKTAFRTNSEEESKNIGKEYRALVKKYAEIKRRTDVLTNQIRFANEELNEVKQRFKQCKL